MSEGLFSALRPDSEGRSLLSSLAQFFEDNQQVVFLGRGNRTKYSYDADGRASTVAWQGDSTGQPGYRQDFTYSLAGVAAGASVFKAVKLNGGGVYSYYYDAFGRRRKKEYPVAGTADEYFYDFNRQLLEDKGARTLEAPAPYPVDEYVWLDGRAVAMVRGRLEADGRRLYSEVQHDAFSTNDCQRNGQKARCGVHYLVNDILPKPVAMLDSEGRVVGVAEYEAFGQVNRKALWADTQHPYPNNLERHTLADWTLPTVAGLEAQARVRFDVMDTEVCGNSKFDPVRLVDGDTGAELGRGPYGGHHQGDVWSDWVAVPPSGHLALTFSSNWRNRAPATSSSPPPGSGQSCILGQDGWPYFGVSVRDYEYRRFEKGTFPNYPLQPLFTPLRFPGQYFDDETGLAENWHRYYDAARGAYLQSEGIGPSAAGQRAGSIAGTVRPAFGYSNGNPLSGVDPSGKFRIDAPNYLRCSNFFDAIGQAMRMAGCGSGGKQNTCNRCQKNIGDCTRGCDICSVLDPAMGPWTIVDAPFEVSMVSSRTVFGVRIGEVTLHVDFDTCMNAFAVDDLARTFLHEAIHVCELRAFDKSTHGGGTKNPGPFCEVDELEYECFK